MALSPAPPLNQRTHVDITIALVQQKMTVLVGQTSALSNGPLDASWPSSAAFAIQLGLTYVASTTGPWTARIDNVVVNLQ